MLRRDVRTPLYECVCVCVRCFQSQPAFAASLGVALRTWQRALAAVSVCERVKHSIRRLRKLTSDHLSCTLMMRLRLCLCLRGQACVLFVRNRA